MSVENKSRIILVCALSLFIGFWSYTRIPRETVEVHTQERDVLKQQLIWLSYRLELLGIKDSSTNKEKEAQQREILRLMRRLDASDFQKADLVYAKHYAEVMVGKVTALQNGIKKLSIMADSLTHKDALLEDSMRIMREAYVLEKVKLRHFKDSLENDKLVIMQFDVHAERQTGKGKFVRVTDAKKVDRLVGVFTLSGGNISEKSLKRYEMITESIDEDTPDKHTKGKIIYLGEGQVVMVYQNFSNTVLKKGRRHVKVYLPGEDTLDTYIDLR